MKKKIKVISIVSIVLIITGTFFMSNLNAASSTHEAEDSANNLKYASVSGNYVEFDATKDAYVEMKSVNSPSSGTMSLTFYYVADNSFPLELKVNGTTVASKDTISSTSSGTVTYQASLNSGDDNTIRFKIRDAVSGIKLDKVIISDGDSSTTEEPSNTATSEPTAEPTDDTTTENPPVSDGDITLNPGDSLEDAINSISAGKTIYLNSGTYKSSSTILIKESNKGTSSNMKKIVGNGNAVVDFSAMSENSSNRGLVVDGSYWNIKNITIKGAGDNGMLLSGDNNIIDDCIFRENHDTGLQLSRYNTSYDSISEWPSNNTIKNCLSTENVDSGREDADGFAPKLTSGKGNLFEDCKAIYNCDDGWDLYTKSDTGAIGVVTFKNCEASNNGKFTDGSSTDGDGNGFKLGDDTASVAHKLYDCVANNNRKHGYTGNGNPAAILLDNCTASGNGGEDFTRLDNAIIK